MAISSQHHSFDIRLASMYGVEEAIIIHHFQHWIRVNRKLHRNFYENCTWTYQTYNEICAHFPYFSYHKVRYAIKNLIKKRILKKGNFNKRKGDQTVWFAFCDEQEFVPDFPDKTGPLSEEMGKLPGGWENYQGGGKITRALPHPKEKIREDKKEREGEERESEREKNRSACASPHSQKIFEYFGKFVKMSKEEYADLSTQFGSDSVNDIIERINDHLASTGKKPYRDYAATVRQWMRNQKKSFPEKRGSDFSLKSNAGINSSLASDLGSKFSSKVHSGEIVIGPDYLEFKYGPHLKFTDNGFRDQALNQLRKMCLPIEGL